MCVACFEMSCVGVGGCANVGEPAPVVVTTESHETVRDYTAILAYLDYPAARFNALLPDPGAPVFVSYRFMNSDQLPPLENVGNNPTGVWAFDAAQRDAARTAMAHLSATAGVVFVETTSDEAMIQFHGATAPQWSGWANYPWVTEWGINVGTVVMNRTDSFAVGSTSYRVLLHELGHAVGLMHPFEGSTRLATDLDFRSNTLMSYTSSGLQESSFSRFDVQALQHLYGTPQTLAGWSWRFEDEVFVLNAGDGADTLLGLRNASRIDGRGGDDLIIGGQGADTLTGGAGNDTLRGMAGANLLIGGDGDDVIEGSQNYGNETLWGGAGNDRLAVVAGNNEVWAGAGRDTVTGGSGTDILGGGDGDDTVDARNGIYSQLWGGFGDDTLQAGHWGDTAGGGAGDDEVTGGSGRDMLIGGLGNDTVFGGTGSDAIYLAMGNDRGYGGDGNDTLFAGPGFDQLWGGAGMDRFEFWRNAGWNRIEDFSDADYDQIALGTTLWASTHGTLSHQQVVDTFGRVNPQGDAVLDFGAAGTVVVVVGLGTLEDLSYSLLLI